MFRRTLATPLSERHDPRSADKKIQNHLGPMGKILILAAYTAYVAFWIRFLMHAIVWWRAVRRHAVPSGQLFASRLKAAALTAVDVILLGRLFRVNPALWLGEWVFHVTFLLVVIRHLRYFLNPVPLWVWNMQTPGIIAGYVMPFSLLYILAVRFFSKREKYAAPANMVFLVLVFFICSIGVFMHGVYKPNLVEVKVFILGVLSFSHAPVPESVLFMVHFLLVLVLLLLLPSHIFTAPLVMYQARTRELALHGVMHDEGE
jgi:nitrate reductase gamma subunit